LFASNRASIPPTFDHQAARRNLHEVLGIDYLSLTFPIFAPGPELDHADRADYHRPDGMRSIHQFTSEADGIKVTTRVAPGKDGWLGSVRFIPSEWVGNPDALAALPITDLHAAVSAVWDKTLEFVAPKATMAEATVTRIDVARDFKVDATAQVALMQGLHKIPVPYASSRPLYNSRRGVPQTLNVGTKTEGKVRVYDRHAKDRVVPPGTLRVEVEVRKKWAIRYAGIETVADLGPSTITDLFTNRFNWAKVGEPVIYESHRLQRLWNLIQDPTANVTPLGAIRFAGGERLQKAGIALNERSSSVAARNALMAVLGASHDSEDAPAYIRLDPAYDTPRQADTA
jgi:hypothetical protein